MTLPLSPVGCMPMFGCPLLENAQHAPLTSTGIIQRPPCDVQNARKRGGVTCDVSCQLNCEQPRAAHWQQVSRSSRKFNSKQPNARHHPPRRQRIKHGVLRMKAPLLAVGCMPMFGCPRLKPINVRRLPQRELFNVRLAMSRMRGSAAA
jgi:hypothetical protein